MTTDLFAILDGAASDAAPLFVIEMPGRVRGKGRPRGTIIRPRGGAPFISFYTDAETRGYENALKQLAAIKMKGRPPFEGPLAVRIFAMMPIPPSWPARDRDAALAGTKFPTTKPDADNIGKSAADALNGVVFLDDTQLIRILVVKEYAECPGLIIEVYRLP